MFKQHPYRSGVKKSPANQGEQKPASMEDRLRTIICEVVGCEERQVTLYTDLRSELAMDSLDLTEVFMRLAEVSGVELAADYDFDRLKSFNDLLLLALDVPVETEGPGGEVSDAPLAV